GFLASRGHVHHLVDIGGELRGHGVKPDGAPWWVALANDAAPGAPVFLVALHELSVATSGDNTRFFIADGMRHSHTLDPRTGYSVRNAIASVSVFHRSCMQADALATALYVLGPDAGFAFAAQRDLRARF